MCNILLHSLYMSDIVAQSCTVAQCCTLCCSFCCTCLYMFHGRITCTHGRITCTHMRCTNVALVCTCTHGRITCTHRRCTNVAQMLHKCCTLFVQRILRIQRCTIFVAKMLHCCTRVAQICATVARALFSYSVMATAFNSQRASKINMK